MVFVLTACGGGGSTATRCVSPPPPAIPVLVSPAPGATAVSTGPLDITLSNGADTLAVFVVSSSDATHVDATNLRPSNPPAPDGRAATVAQLAPQTTYRVFARVNRQPDPCLTPGVGTPVSPDAYLGSFTTR